MQHSHYFSDSQDSWQISNVARLSSNITYEQAVAMVSNRNHAVPEQRGFGFNTLTSQLNSLSIQQQYAGAPAGGYAVTSLAATFQQLSTADRGNHGAAARVQQHQVP
jgi:hypothetical protein